mgnify:CR=1 FL=1
MVNERTTHAFKCLARVALLPAPRQETAALAPLATDLGLPWGLGFLEIFAFLICKIDGIIWFHVPLSEHYPVGFYVHMDLAHLFFCCLFLNRAEAH